MNKAQLRKFIEGQRWDALRKLRMETRKELDQRYEVFRSDGTWKQASDMINNLEQHLLQQCGCDQAKASRLVSAYADLMYNMFLKQRSIKEFQDQADGMRRSIEKMYQGILEYIKQNAVKECIPHIESLGLLVPEEAVKAATQPYQPDPEILDLAKILIAPQQLAAPEV